jgi:hypothetical protein
MCDAMQHVGPIHSSLKEKGCQYRWHTYSQ